jgi:aminoglycoside/choline kinase family phosphotransferase
MREDAFFKWFKPLVQKHQLRPETLALASADASFRRYFRALSLNPTHPSLIIMDAPPELEDTARFVNITILMQQAGLKVAELLEYDPQEGFLLLEDLGAHTMMQALPKPLAMGAPTLLAPPLDPVALSEPNPQAQALFEKAIDALILWQLSSRKGSLPEYDHALLRRELGLFDEWYLGQAKGVPQSDLAHHMKQTLEPMYALIIEHNLRAPQTFVHRDFMPRNLMLPKHDNAPLGVLDYQDSVYGPITYDIASLMRDAFISWPEEFVLDITIRYWERARAKGLLDQNGFSEDFGAFYRAVEWMGLQRHLKVAGIFARLSLRDHKHHYLVDAPRFIHYIRSTASRYSELKPLLKLIDHVENIAPIQAFTLGQRGQ